MKKNSSRVLNVMVLYTEVYFADYIKKVSCRDQTTNPKYSHTRIVDSVCESYNSKDINLRYVPKYVRIYEQTSD